MEGHRDAMLISSSAISLSWAVEDDKPLAERARMSAGGPVLTKHTLVEKSFTQSVRQLLFWWGEPFWIWTVWGFSEAFHVCSIAGQRTHGVCLMWQRWWGTVQRRFCTAAGKGRRWTTIWLQYHHLEDGGSHGWRNRVVGTAWKTSLSTLCEHIGRHNLLHST